MAMVSGKRRFSLLELEHEEALLESAAVVDAGSREGGRLWICSRSVVFEPLNVSLPLQRLSFRDMQAMPSVVQVDVEEDSVEGSALEFTAGQVTEMKREGKSQPYVTVPGHYNKVFTLKHGSVDRTLALIQALWTVAEQVKQAPKRDRQSTETKLLAPLIEKRLNLSFDKSRLVDFREVALLTKEVHVSLVSQMLEIPGCILITDQHLYFQPAELNNIGEVVKSFPLKRLRGVYKRRFLLRQRALEVRFEPEFAATSQVLGTSTGSRDSSMLLCFKDGTRVRDMIFDLLERIHDKNNPDAAGTGPGGGGSRLDRLQAAWQRRELSNFEYLSELNTLADRSVADLTQYPVFPWVIADYESATLDLQASETFRDLSKPIGALNLERLESFRERYRHLCSDPDPNTPPFLYGTHYTTPGYVLYYLVRQAPDQMLRLQNGQFDRPDRLFSSISSTWSSVLNNPADLKELIPEFYDTDGSFLMNLNQLDLGQRQDGKFVDDVELPPWADSARDFVSKCRSALESDYVSEHLHLWIDLIFGFKQRGDAAIEADNLFYYLTYEGAVDLDTVTDETERKAYEAQIYEFGQTPKQLFTAPHPSRDDHPRLAKVPELKQGDTSSSESREEENLSPALEPASSSLSGHGRVEQDLPTGNSSPEIEIREPSPPSIVEGSNDAVPSTLSKSSESNAEAVNRVQSSSVPVFSNWWYMSGSRDALQLYAVSAEIKAHRGMVSSLCSMSKSAILFSVSRDGSLSQSCFDSKSVLRRVVVGKLALGCCIEARDGSLLVGSWDNSLYVCSADYGRVLHRIPAHDDAICCISCNGSRRVVVTGSWDSSLKVWTVPQTNVKTMTVVASFYDHQSELSAVDMDHAGRFIASASSSGDVLVHDLRLGEVVYTFSSILAQRRTFAIGVFWVHNGGALAICSRDGFVDVLELAENLSPILTIDPLLPEGSFVTAAGITSDRLNVVLGTSCGRVILCNINLMGGPHTASSRNAARTILQPKSPSASSNESSDPDTPNTSKFPRKPSNSGALRSSGVYTEEQENSVTSLLCTSGAVLVGTSDGVIRVLGPEESCSTNE